MEIIIQLIYKRKGKLMKIIIYTLLIAAMFMAIGYNSYLCIKWLKSKLISPNAMLTSFNDGVLNFLDISSKPFFIMQTLCVISSIIATLCIIIKYNSISIFYIIITILMVYLLFGILYNIMLKIDNFLENLRYTLIGNKLCINFVGLLYLYMSFLCLKIFAEEYNNKIILLYYIILGVIYISTFTILLNIMQKRLKVVKLVSKKAKIYFLIIICCIIISFILVFYISNSILNYINPNSFTTTSNLKYFNKFDMFYYTFSLFFSFCSENIITLSLYGQIISIISKFTTIFCITFLFNIVVNVVTDEHVTEDSHNSDIENSKEQHPCMYIHRLFPKRLQNKLENIPEKGYDGKLPKEIIKKIKEIRHDNKHKIKDKIKNFPKKNTSIH